MPSCRAGALILFPAKFPAVARRLRRLRRARYFSRRSSLFPSTAEAPWEWNHLYRACDPTLDERIRARASNPRHCPGHGNHPRIVISSRGREKCGSLSYPQHGVIFKIFNYGSLLNGANESMDHPVKSSAVNFYKMVRSSAQALGAVFWNALVRMGIFSSRRPVVVVNAGSLVTRRSPGHAPISKRVSARIRAAMRTVSYVTSALLDRSSRLRYGTRARNTCRSAYDTWSSGCVVYPRVALWVSAGG